MIITKEKLIELYVKQNLGTVAISKLIGCGKTTVLNYLYKYNIPVKNNGQQIKYVANHDFFKKWSSDMAYILGFISADGHVWKNRPYLTIGIHQKDIKVLEFIRDKVSPTSKVRLTHNMCQICIHSNEIWKDLKQLGVDNDKTFNLQLCDVPEQYFCDYLRGYFDGDGGIWKCKFTPNGKDYYYSGIISASFNFLSSLHKKIGFGNFNKIKNKYYELKFSQSDSLKLYDIMYQNENSFKLERKYKKFLQIDIIYKFWSNEENNILLHNLDKKPKELMKLLKNRSVNAIKSQKARLKYGI